MKYVLYHLFRLTYRFKRWRAKRFTPLGQAVLIGLVVSAIVGLDTKQTMAYQAFTLLLSVLLIELAGSLFAGKDLDPGQIERFQEIIGGGDYHSQEKITLIKKCLITQRQRRWLFDEDLDLHDIMEGRYPHKISKKVVTMLRSWNKKAGAKLFYED